MGSKDGSRGAIGHLISLGERLPGSPDRTENLTPGSAVVEVWGGGGASAHRPVPLEPASAVDKALKQSVQALLLTVEVRDPYTAIHQRRVAGLSVEIAQEMALPRWQKQGLELAGLVHDMGKIAIPAEILARPGALSEIDFLLIKKHCEVGHGIVSAIDFPWPIADVVLQHHERLDGSGYPNGLSDQDGGGRILLEARILAVADVVEAMIAHRPYRAALGFAVTVEEITKGSGTLYDAEVVQACVAVLHRRAAKDRSVSKRSNG